MSRNRRGRRVGLLCLLMGCVPLLVGQSCIPTPPGPGDGDDGSGQPIPPSDQAPNIVFTLPAAGSTFMVGDPVDVSLDANDPENEFDYELFYDRDGVFNGNEVSFETGSRDGSSLVQTIWSTGGLPAGQYFIAAIVTDAAGNVDRAFSEAVTLVNAPTIEVIAPSASITRTVGETVTVVFHGNDLVGGATIDVFFDTDNNFNNGVAGVIAEGLAASATTVAWNTTGVQPGTYFVGASIGTDTTGRVADYAPGQITITSSTEGEDGQGGDEEDLTGLELLITEPSTVVTVGQGASLTIEFTARDPAGTAWVDLYYVKLTSDGSVPPYTGNEPKIATNLPVTTTSYTWKVDVEPGVYMIGGTLGRTETARIRDIAEGKVLVTPSQGGGEEDDTDGDGVADAVDNCPEVSNPDQADSDGDGIGDACDEDGETTPVSITMTAPSALVTTTPQTATTVAFELDPADAPGQVRLYYAQDEDQDHQPDDPGDWVQFAVLTPPSNSANFIPVDLGLTSGIFAFKGVYEPQRGSGYSAADPDGDVADGWVQILQGRTIDVQSPSENFVVQLGAVQFINFLLEGRDPTGQSRINLFWDRDGIINDNEVEFLVDLPLDTTVVTVDVDALGLQPGIYFLGASIGPNETNRDYDYAGGVMLVVAAGEPLPTEGILVVTQPSSPNGAAGGSISVTKNDDILVRWFYYGPARGTVRVFAEPDATGPNGQPDQFPDGAGTRIYAPETFDINKVWYRYSASGLQEDTTYFIGVVRTEGGTASYAPATVRVVGSTLWVGNVADSYLPGAVFEGVTNRDFAGSSLAPVGDLDGDGIGDFVIVAQFAKPGLNTIDGLGVGEAYVIFGGEHLSGRRWKLNGTGVLYSENALPGLVLTGLGTVPQGLFPVSGDQAGITNVVAVPDQDEDGRPELAFGFPQANSTPSHCLSRVGHFNRGGIVLISSQNYIFRNRTATHADGDRIYSLLTTGQVFACCRAATPIETMMDEYGCKPADSDNDGVPDDGDGSGKVGDKPCKGGDKADCDDNCLNIPNEDQKDENNNGVGDACDPDYEPADPEEKPPITDDADGDGIPDASDNCPIVRNQSQGDIDGDGIGDACDPDMDGDGVWNAYDNCVGVPNPDQEDGDEDGVGDACIGDSDGDGWPNGGSNRDNCPLVPNPDQTDTDHNGEGDDCSPGQPFYPETECGNITVCQGGKEDGCTESVQDHGIGFYPDLLDDRDFPWWGAGLVSPGCTGIKPFDCKCPRINVLQDIRIDKKPSIVGGFRPVVVPGDQGEAPYLFAGAAYLSSGFDPEEVREPYGFRLLGQEEGDMFAWSLSFVDDMLLIGAPYRTTNGGAYMVQMRNRERAKPIEYGGYYGDRTDEASTTSWAAEPGVYDRIWGPRPYQYIVGNGPGSPGSTASGGPLGQGHSFGDVPDGTPVHLKSPTLEPVYWIHNNPDGDGIDPDPNRMDEQIGYHISGVADFNGDGLGDVLVGAPSAFSAAAGYDDSGAVYLLLRRMIHLEGDRDLARVELADVNDPLRLFGVLIRGRAGERLGYTVGFGGDINGDNIAEMIDLNGDGLGEVILGNYHHDNDRGEVVILFSNPYLISPAGGFRIEDDDPATPDLLSDGLAAVIKGEQPGDLAGYNVGYGGDFNGDGKADLLIAAPNASPEVDTDGDGVLETLTGAGKVYLISGANPIEPGDVLNLADVGTPALKGLVFAGREPGDHLGGGEKPSFWEDPVNGVGATGIRPRNVSWAGDVNADGFDDILIGAPLADVGSDVDPDGNSEDAGEVYLIYGFAF